MSAFIRGLRDLVLTILIVYFILLVYQSGTVLENSCYG